MTRDKGKKEEKKGGKKNHIFNNDSYSKKSNVEEDQKQDENKMRKQGLATPKLEFAADFRHELRRKFFQLEQG